MCPRWGQLDTFSTALPSNENRTCLLSSDDQDLRCGVQMMHLDRLRGIKSNQKVLRIGVVDRQHSTHCVSRWSHQYNIVSIMLAEHPVNIPPIYEQPICEELSACTSPSIYTLNKTGLRTTPCFTPLVTLNHRDWLLFQTTRVTWHTTH